jgi:hypothetical protein
MDQTQYYRILKPNFTQADRLIGKELSRIADKVMDLSGGWGDPHHNEIFGMILSHYLRRFSPKKWHVLLAKSMQKNFSGQAQQAIFKIIKITDWAIYS